MGFVRIQTDRSLDSGRLASLCRTRDGAGHSFLAALFYLINAYEPIKKFLTALLLNLGVVILNRTAFYNIVVVMNIQFFNLWYFLFLALSIGGFVGLYFLLRNRSRFAVKSVLIALMVFALVLHFMKGLFPPYSLDYDRHLRDSWFINICGANIALFPFMLVSKNKYVKDYMFYIGVLSGLIAVIYPIDPVLKPDQSAEVIDVLRFYLHHNLLWYVPMLMVLLKLHELDYRRIWATPVIFLLVMLFVMLNQIFQSELGFIGLRGDDIHGIPYVNNSMIWGPDGNLSRLIDWACPEFFKTIPVGAHKGEEKYWPWFWLIVPCFVILIPVCFLMAMIFDFGHIKKDAQLLKCRLGAWRKKEGEKHRL